MNTTSNISLAMHYGTYWMKAENMMMHQILSKKLELKFHVYDMVRSMNCFFYENAHSSWHV